MSAVSMFLSNSCCVARVIPTVRIKFCRPFICLNAKEHFEKSTQDEAVATRDIMSVN